MYRTVACPVFLASLIGLITAGGAPAQPPGLPANPVPIVPGGASPPSEGAVPGPPAAVLSAPQPLPATPPPPPGPAPYVLPFQDRNGPLLGGDPLLEGPDAPGWFAGVDIELVAPHLKNALVAPVNVSVVGTRDVHAPEADLDWTGSPSVSVGYRFAQGCGAFVATYRFLVSEGMMNVPDYDLLGAGAVRSRLNMNVLDLDYVSREWSLGPLWDLDWRAGIRVAAVYFDSRAMGQFMEDRTSNNFIGAGPHLGLEVARHLLELPGLSVFAGVDGALLLGHIDQNFEETFTVDNALAAGGATHQSMTQAVPVLRFETGLTWAPPCDNTMRFTVGYQYEHWWYLGQVGDSRAELTDQGVFFRSEFRF
jgi:hypothetical protein